LIIKSTREINRLNNIEVVIGINIRVLPLSIKMSPGSLPKNGILLPYEIASPTRIKAKPAKINILPTEITIVS